MIDFFKDVFDMIPIKWYALKEFCESFLRDFLAVIKGITVFLTLIAIFLSLVRFMYYAFYLNDYLEWCVVFIISLPILVWVNIKM